MSVRFWLAICASSYLVCMVINFEQDAVLSGEALRMVVLPHKTKCQEVVRLRAELFIRETFSIVHQAHTKLHRPKPYPFETLTRINNMVRHSSQRVFRGEACRCDERGNLDMKNDYFPLVQRIEEATDLMSSKVDNLRKYGRFDEPNGVEDKVSGDQLWDEFMALQATIWGEESDESSLRYLRAQHVKEYRRKWGAPDFRAGAGQYNKLLRLYPEHSSELNPDLVKHQVIETALECFGVAVILCQTIVLDVIIAEDPRQTRTYTFEGEQGDGTLMQGFDYGCEDRIGIAA
ncbi:hypothetical protein EDD37DRAFT_606889 [Exophiala viscosa]|uniref:Uncharacterized protein n=1 Tax=Exophiala viscosa TaxID=2486360 RepID=A0AAN6E832_9EURO|nr:hypothetical protein EDD36DRAFT_471267 [Exophiala viscosa]KAI1628109.1 hypothetical protein EDD37DRAFT_606889 [Exophiala viscosa]